MNGKPWFLCRGTVKINSPFKNCTPAEDIFEPYSLYFLLYFYRKPFPLSL